MQLNMKDESLVEQKLSHMTACKYDVFLGQDAGQTQQTTFLM